MQQESKQITKQQKIYFVYFIIISIVVLLIFAFIIFGSFWDYWSEIKNMEKYYRGRLIEFTQEYPQINSFDPIKGNTTAKVTIIEYGDFVCSSCKNLQADLAALEKFYGNKIRIVFKGYPIAVNSQNRPSLNAGYCAWEQGAFWQYKDLLYADNLQLSKQKYIEYANQLDLDLDKFNECIENNKYIPVINQNLSEGISLQINSIPTVYINKQRIEGFINYNSLKNTIDQELNK